MKWACFLSEVFLQLVFSIIFSVETVTSALRYFLKDVGPNMLVTFQVTVPPVIQCACRRGVEDKKVDLFTADPETTLLASHLN